MAHRWALYLMITTTAAYPAAPLDLPPLGQTGLTDASMNNNNNNNNNNNVKSLTAYRITILDKQKSRNFRLFFFKKK